MYKQKKISYDQCQVFSSWPGPVTRIKTIPSVSFPTTPHHQSFSFSLIDEATSRFCRGNY
jgi:hypothetical protein